MKDTAAHRAPPFTASMTEGFRDDPEAITVTSHTIRAADGVPLEARVYANERRMDFTALMLPGIGVPQRAFRHMARWMAERGVRCVTVDYRGIGRSMTRDGIATASLSTWASVDVPAAMGFCESLGPQPVVLIGHSFGGQAVGLAPALHRASAAVFIGSQLGDARYWDGAARWGLTMYWHVILPFFARLFRELPAWTGPAGRLPRGVAAEWSRWGRSANWYLSEVPGSKDLIARFNAPVLAYGIQDDPIAPPRAVSAFLELFSATSPVRRNVDTREVGLEHVGHVGLLRPSEGVLPIWKEVLDFLRRAAGDSIAAPMLKCG